MIISKQVENPDSYIMGIMTIEVKNYKDKLVEVYMGDVYVASMLIQDERPHVVRFVVPQSPEKQLLSLEFTDDVTPDMSMSAVFKFMTYMEVPSYWVSTGEMMRLISDTADEDFGIAYRISYP